MSTLSSFEEDLMRISFGLGAERMHSLIKKIVIDNKGEFPFHLKPSDVSKDEYFKDEPSISELALMLKDRPLT